MNRPSAPAAASRRLWIQVGGVGVSGLSNQTLLNGCPASAHGDHELLACLECAAVQLSDTALERITWALLSWPGVDRLYLHDVGVRGVIARLWRIMDQPLQREPEAFVWRGVWCKGGAELLPLDEDVAALPVFPPQGAAIVGIVAAPAWLPGIRGLLDTSAVGVAQRERAKLWLQRVLGIQLTRRLQNAYQGSTEKLRQARKNLRCRAAEALPHIAGLSAGHDDGLIAVLMMVPRLDPGGAEKNIIDLAIRLPGLGVRVHMMTTIEAENGWAERLNDAGIELIHLPDFLPGNCWFSFVSTFISSRRISHLHVMNSHWAYENLARIKGRFPDLKVVTHLHAEGEPGTLDFPSLAARHDADIDVHSVISEHLADYMHERLHLTRQRMRVIRTGIDAGVESDNVAAESDWRARNNVASDIPVVIFVGRFSELKRPLLFLEIAQKVLQACPHALFVMKGQGPLEGRIRRRLASSAILSEQVLIEAPGQPVAWLMADADVLVLPSTMEGIAYVSYEAMAHGLPQVYADVGGQSELLDPGTGIAIAPGADELVAYVDAVLKLIGDVGLRRRMGLAARSALAAWPTADEAAICYFKLYTELLKH